MTENTILLGDCVEQLNRLPAGSVDLAFADPPFNIGYDYDVYQDRLEQDQYIAWSRDWIAAVHRALSDRGTFWLAIGDEYAAELKIEAQKIGFKCRSWVVWYYTFGVNCNKKFSRSHAHLFYFVKDAANFTFRETAPENRIPSARQLVYNDTRANPAGRLPDDTWIIRPADALGEMTPDDEIWIPGDVSPPADPQNTFSLRPQDLADCFTAAEDTWYFPRVAGTFKERAGFHGCQMPEQLLARIIRACSNENDLVLDPFSGSATTLAVAKKLGRRYLGFDISGDYVARGKERLAAIRVGDRLDGSAEPLLSAPATAGGDLESDFVSGSKKKRRSNDKTRAALRRPMPKGPAFGSPADIEAKERRYGEAQLQLTLQGVVEAFRLAHDGFSADRVVVDPNLNASFADDCRRLGLAGEPRIWNILLFRLRKAGRLAHLETTRPTDISWHDCDGYLFASEIALQSLLDGGRAQSLDEILCDPILAAELDKLAASFAPGRSPLEYRWAALKLRKQAKNARTRARVLHARRPPRLGKITPIDELDLRRVPDRAGVYVVSQKGPAQKLYIGEALNLRGRLQQQFDPPQRQRWAAMSKSLGIQTFLTETLPAEMLAWQSCLVGKYRPKLNFRDLAPPVRCATANAAD